MVILVLNSSIELKTIELRVSDYLCLATIHSIMVLNVGSEYSSVSLSFYCDFLMFFQENYYWLDRILRSYQSRVYSGDLGTSFEVGAEVLVYQPDIVRRSLFFWLNYHASLYINSQTSPCKLVV